MAGERTCKVLTDIAIRAGFIEADARLAKDKSGVDLELTLDTLRVRAEAILTAVKQARAIHWEDK